MGTRLYILIFLVLAIVLAIRVFTHFQSSDILKNGQQVNFVVRLTEEPEIKGGRQQFRIKTEKGERIRIITGLVPLLKYGDRISISGKIKSNDYKGHTFFTLNFPQLQTEINDQNYITRLATHIRLSASELSKNSLPPVSSSLITGIVFGGNQGMPDKFMDHLRISGVVHVIAASGMNVTFVASALMGILGSFLKRKIALTIAIFGIIFYAFVSGFEPSIVRASIMSVVAFSASLLGRQNFAVGSVFLTGFIMLMLSPFLVLDVGFQLSFLATLGILFIKPLISNGKSILLSDDISTTIAAQIATIPIILGVFGDYGVLSVMVNALVLWTVPILMILGAVATILGMVFEPLGKIVFFISLPVLLYFETVVSFFGNLGWVLKIQSFSGFVWIGYYLILGSGIIFIRSRKQEKS